MTTTRRLHRIALDLFYGRDDGATVPTVVGVRVPESGYVVALPRLGHLLTHTTGVTAALQEIELWVGDVVDRASLPGHYVGVWSDDDLAYLDVVEVLPERAVAIQAAKDRWELCIFDLAAKAEIRVPVPEPVYA